MTVQCTEKNPLTSIPNPQTKYVCICPCSALAGSCLLRELNITSKKINSPEAGYYQSSYNSQQVQNRGRGDFFPLPKYKVCITHVAH